MSEEALQIAEERREVKGKGERESSLQENWRYQGNISCNPCTIKDRNGKELTEVEEIKKRQEHTELYKKKKS